MYVQSFVASHFMKSDSPDKRTKPAQNYFGTVTMLQDLRPGKWRFSILLGQEIFCLFAPSKPAMLHIISNRRCFPGVKRPRREDHRSNVILLCLHSPVHAVWYFIKRRHKFGCALMNAWTLITAALVPDALTLYVPLLRLVRSPRKVLPACHVLGC